MLTQKERQQVIVFLLYFSIVNLFPIHEDLQGGDPIWLRKQMEDAGLQAGLCSIHCSRFAQKFEPGLCAFILE